MESFGYGLWFLVVINSAIFILFAVSFFHPRSGRDWRALGAFSGFLVALFTEMYGFPLTIYLLSGVFGAQIGLTHDTGHLWSDLIRWPWDPHLSPFHLASYALIAGGFWLIASAWSVLWRAQKSGALATTGAYARVQHPQYAGFLLVMIGFLLQWPTLVTLVMFPILVVVYRRLAGSEEHEVRAHFGNTWDAYAARTPRFAPHLRSNTADTDGIDRTTGTTRQVVGYVDAGWRR
jgi:protein-S-isoprenylcysteine O-methyltransferase Ste14